MPFCPVTPIHTIRVTWCFRWGRPSRVKYPISMRSFLTSVDFPSHTTSHFLQLMNSLICGWGSCLSDNGINLPLCSSPESRAYAFAQVLLFIYFCSNLNILLLQKTVDYVISEKSVKMFRLTLRIGSACFLRFPNVPKSSSNSSPHGLFSRFCFQFHGSVHASSRDLWIC